MESKKIIAIIDDYVACKIDFPEASLLLIAEGCKSDDVIKLIGIDAMEERARQIKK